MELPLFLVEVKKPSVTNSNDLLKLGMMLQTAINKWKQLGFHQVTIAGVLVEGR
jgi:hypothetical protein